MTNKEIAGEIANRAIEKLREKHFDAVNKNDKWHDISSEIHNAIFYTIGEKFEKGIIANPVDAVVSREVGEHSYQLDNYDKVILESLPLVEIEYGFINIKNVEWLKVCDIRTPTRKEIIIKVDE